MISRTDITWTTLRNSRLSCLDSSLGVLETLPSGKCTLGETVFSLRRCFETQLYPWNWKATLRKSMRMILLGTTPFMLMRWEHMSSRLQNPNRLQSKKEIFLGFTHQIMDAFRGRLVVSILCSSDTEHQLIDRSSLSMVCWQSETDSREHTPSHAQGSLKRMCTLLPMPIHLHLHRK